MIKIKVADQSVRQEVVGDYTLKEMADGFTIYALILRHVLDNKESYLGKAGFVAISQEYLEKYLGITEEELPRLADFLVNTATRYTTNGKKGKTVHTGAVIGSGITWDGEKFVVSMIEDGLMRYLLRGDTLKQAFKKQARWMYRQLRTEEK